MKRFLLLVLVLCVAVLVPLAGWFAFSNGGLQAVSRIAVAASGGRLELAGAEGRLAGPFAFARVAWREAGLVIVADGLRADWRPDALGTPRLAIDGLEIARLAIDWESVDADTPPPAHLRLPFAVDIGRLAIAQLVIGKLFELGDVRATLASDGEQHRLGLLRALSGKLELQGSAELGVMAPFPLAGQASIAGVVDGRPLRLAVVAGGELARIDIAVHAEEGISGRAAGVLTPLARRPFAEVKVALDDVDPAAWLPGAPSARLALAASARPANGEPGAVSGEFSLRNRRAMAFDRGGLPVDELAGRFDWTGDAARLDSLLVRLPGGGTLAGKGAWRDGALDLEMAARQVDPARLAGMLRSTRLNGPISATIGRERQRLAARLAGPAFTIAAEAGHEAGRVRLRNFELAAGTARLQVSADLATGGNRDFSANGELVAFDPRRFADVPAASLSGRLAAAGRLEPRLQLDAKFTLLDSRFAGQALGGEGDIAIEWPRVRRADLQLRAGPNQIRAAGAFGAPGDRLMVALEAPRLEPYGLEGGIGGHLEVGGTPDRPTLAADLSAARFGLPGLGRLSGARLVADLGSATDSPLRADLRVDGVDLAGTPGLARGVVLALDGTRRQHELRGSAELFGGQFKLAAGGSFPDGSARLPWSGSLQALSFAAGDKRRSFSLAGPAPLRVEGDGWVLGPLELRGESWQLRADAAAAGQKLHAVLSARGPRIGELDGQLDAALRGPWALDRQMPWRGEMRTAISDLAWLGELSGERWQTAGRLQANLQLAGNPERPSLSGTLRGDDLALSFPEQGMRLVRGGLSAQLDDNLLTIGMLGFDSLLEPVPRPLRLADPDGAGQLAAGPGRLEIAGRLRVDRDRAGDSAALDLRLDRFGAYQLPDQWLVLSGGGQISWTGNVLGIRGKLLTDGAWWQLADAGVPRLSDDVRIRAGSAADKPGVPRPSLDLDLEADLGRQFHFRGAGLSTRLAGSLRVQAKGRDLPRAEGRIRMRDGRFDAYGQHLEIERGIVTFRGLLDNPGLDVRAVRTGLPVEPGVQVSGTAQRPVVRLVSDPEMPDAEKLSWLVLGHGPEQGSAADAAVLLAAAGSLLGSEKGNVVQQIKRATGIDEFGVRQGAIGGSGGSLPSSRVVGGSFDTAATTSNQILSVGKRLSNDVLLAYEQSLNKAESVVKLTVRLNRQLAVIARAGTDNALDMLYTISFGGPPARADRRRQPGETQAAGESAGGR